MTGVRLIEAWKNSLQGAWEDTEVIEATTELLEMWAYLILEISLN